MIPGAISRDANHRIRLFFQSIRESTMLKGKNAVVTGSTSGIGLGIARAFAKDGANVLINGFGAAADIEKERAGSSRSSASRLSIRRPT